MGDQQLGDMISNVGAIGVVLEKIFWRNSSAATSPTPASCDLMAKESYAKDKNIHEEIVSSFISRLSALNKEIQASGSGRPVSRAGEDSLYKLRKGIHQAATSLGLAIQQEVVGGPQLPLLFQNNGRDIDDGMWVVAGACDDTSLVKAASSEASGKGVHSRSGFCFGWSKASRARKKKRDMGFPSSPFSQRRPRYGRCKSDAELRGVVVQSKSGNEKSLRRSYSRLGSTGGELFRRIACCVVPQAGVVEDSCMNCRAESMQEKDKLGCQLAAKLHYWDKELTRLRDQAINSGAFVRQSRLTETICGGPGFTNSPRSYVRLNRLVDSIVQTLRSGSQKVVLLRGRSGMGKSLLALDVAFELDKGLDYSGGVYYLHFGDRFGTECNEADLDTKILQQQKLLITLMSYPGDKVSDTPGISKADTAQLLATKLSGKRSLVILDDVWSPKIVEKFMVTGHRGKLLVTSSCRLTDGIQKKWGGKLGAFCCAAFQVVPEDYRGEKLDHKILESCSWTTIDAESKDAANKILDACGGCPLAVSIVGAMLRGKDASEWEKISAELVTMRQGLKDVNIKSEAMSTQHDEAFVSDGSFISILRKSNFSEPSFECFDVGSFSMTSNVKEEVKFVAEGSFLSMRGNFSNRFLHHLGVNSSRLDHSAAGSLRMDSNRVSDPSNPSEFWVVEPKLSAHPEFLSATIFGVIELCLSKLPKEQGDAMKVMALFQSACFIPAPLVQLAAEVMHGCSHNQGVLDALVQTGLVHESSDKKFYWLHSLISRHLSRHRVDIDVNVGDQARLLDTFLLSYGCPEVRQAAAKRLGLEFSVLGDSHMHVQKLAFALQDDQGGVQAKLVLATTLRHSADMRTSLGDLKCALTELNRAQELEPDDYIALQMRGAILVFNEEFDDALADVNRADQLMPNDSFTLQIRGNIKRCVNDNEGAVQDLEKANQLDPNKSFILGVLGAAKLNLGDYHGALTDLDRANQLEPNDHFILSVMGNTKLHLEDYHGALQDLNKALDRTLDKRISDRSFSWVLEKPAPPEGDPNRSFSLSIRGAVKLNLGDLEGAMKDLDEANSLFPHDSFTLKLRATVKVQVGDYLGSVQDLNQCFGLDPHDFDVLRFRGNVKRCLGDYEGALQDFNLSNYLEPGNSFTLKFRGNVKRCLGDLQGALEDLYEANKLSPDGFTLLIRASVKGVSGDHEGALADLNCLLQSEPATAFGLLQRGLAKCLTRDLEGALVDLDRAHEKQPHSANIVRHRGHVKFLLSDIPGSQADHAAAQTLKACNRPRNSVGLLPVEVSQS